MQKQKNALVERYHRSHRHLTVKYFSLFVLNVCWSSFNSNSIPSSQVANCAANNDRRVEEEIFASIQISAGCNTSSEALAAALALHQKPQHITIARW